MPRRDIHEDVILFYKGNRFRGNIINASASGLLIETDAQPTPKINDDFLLLFQMETNGGSMGKLAVKAQVSRIAGNRDSSLSGYGLIWQSAECDTSPAPIQAFKKRMVPDAGGVVRVHPPNEKHTIRRFTYTFSSQKTMMAPAQTAVPVLSDPIPMPAPIATNEPIVPVVETAETITAIKTAGPEESIGKENSTQQVQSKVSPVSITPAPSPARKNGQTVPLESPTQSTPQSEVKKSNERRASNRSVQLISIEYAHRGTRSTGFLTDISRNGAFIQTRNELPPIDGTLSISIKVDRFPIRISARIVRQNRSDSLENPAGFGIEFLPHKDPYRQEEFMRAIESMT